MYFCGTQISRVVKRLYLSPVRMVRILCNICLTSNLNPLKNNVCFVVLYRSLSLFFSLVSRFSFFLFVFLSLSLCVSLCRCLCLSLSLSLSRSLVLAAPTMSDSIQIRMSAFEASATSQISSQTSGGRHQARVTP